MPTAPTCGPAVLTPAKLPAQTRGSSPVPTRAPTLSGSWPTPRGTPRQGHLIVAPARLECVRLAAAFLAGGSYGQRRARRTRPSPPEGSEGGPGSGWPLTSPLVSARESEESGGKPHALPIGPGEN